MTANLSDQLRSLVTAAIRLGDAARAVAEQSATEARQKLDSPPDPLRDDADLPETSRMTTHQDPTLAAFVAEHAPRNRFSAPEMIDTWDHLSTVPAAQGLAPYYRQLAAAVRWVQQHHGQQVAASFVTYLSDAASPDRSS
jgi:hypothetical protein